MLVSELITQAHEAAKAKGWHDGKEPTIDRIAALLALVHTEICEYTHAIAPFSQALELADVVIRLADCYGASGYVHAGYDCNLAEVQPDTEGGPLALHGLIAKMTEDLRNGVVLNRRAFIDVWRLCAGMMPGTHYGRNAKELLLAVKCKMAVNEKRPMRHGGKLL